MMLVNQWAAAVARVVSAVTEGFLCLFLEGENAMKAVGAVIWICCNHFVAVYVVFLYRAWRVQQQRP